MPLQNWFIAVRSFLKTLHARLGTPKFIIAILGALIVGDVALRVGMILLRVALRFTFSPIGLLLALLVTSVAIYDYFHEGQIRRSISRSIRAFVAKHRTT